jgi:N-methylhydantoinase B/oxoprolinase/acetone carboxylase alpha subunit
MGHVQANAEEAVRRVIDKLPTDQPLTFTYAMDDGAKHGHGHADGNPSISIKVL